MTRGRKHPRLTAWVVICIAIGVLQTSEAPHGPSVHAGTVGTPPPTSNYDDYEANSTIASQWWGGGVLTVSQRYGCTNVGPNIEPFAPSGWCPQDYPWWHEGIDVPMATGTAIYSRVTGTILGYDSANGILGIQTGSNVIYLVHGYAVVTSGTVNPGTKVFTADSLFGPGGSCIPAGNCSHLHFELRSSSSDYPYSINRITDDLNPELMLTALDAPMSEFSKTVTGDFNGDGYADTAVLYNEGYPVTDLWEWEGKSDGTLASPTQVFHATAWDWSASKITVGDFYCDGYSSVAILYKDDPTHASLYMLRGSSAGLPSWPSVVFSHNGMWWDAVKMSAGAFHGNVFHGNGCDDLAILYRDDATHAKVFTYNGSPSGLYGVWPPVWGPSGFAWDQAKLTAGQFSGNGYADLVAVYTNLDGTNTIWVWPGGPYGLTATISRWWGPLTGFDWNAATFVSADFNGANAGFPYDDPYDDLVMVYNEGNRTYTVWAWRGQAGTGFQPLVEWVYGTGLYASQMRITAGDYNGNGYADLAVLYNDGYLRSCPVNTQGSMPTSSIRISHGSATGLGALASPTWQSCGWSWAGSALP